MVDTDRRRNATREALTRLRKSNSGSSSGSSSGRSSGSSSKDNKVWLQLIEAGHFQRAQHGKAVALLEAGVCVYM